MIIPAYINGTCKVITKELIARAFEKTGLYPVNHNVFMLEDFALSKASSTTAHVPDSFPHMPSFNPIDPSDDDFIISDNDSVSDHESLSSDEGSLSDLILSNACTCVTHLMIAITTVTYPTQKPKIKTPDHMKLLSIMIKLKIINQYLA